MPSGIARTDLVYCAWTSERELLRGAAVTEAAARAPLGYVSSAPVVPLALNGLVRGIAEIHKLGSPPYCRKKIGLVMEMAAFPH